MAEHTPTPWEYRPHRHDDWGWIRGPKEDGDEIGPLVATARSGKWQSESDLDEHRRNKTDPYGANAAFIVKAVNNHDALVKRLREARAAIASLSMESLGFASAENGEQIHWPIRDELLHRIDTVLDDVGGSRE